MRVGGDEFKVRVRGHQSTAIERCDRFGLHIVSCQEQTAGTLTYCICYVTAGSRAKTDDALYKWSQLDPNGMVDSIGPEPAFDAKRVSDPQCCHRKGVWMATDDYVCIHCREAKCPA